MKWIKVKAGERKEKRNERKKKKRKKEKEKEKKKVWRKEEKIECVESGNIELRGGLEGERQKKKKEKGKGGKE